MKAFAIPALVAVACLIFGEHAHAQYKGPRDYFPKSFPAPAPGSRTLPGATNAPGKTEPAKPQQPKFKDLPVNTGFYFVSDTNRTFLWNKTSTTQAKNSKNGVVQTIHGETPIVR